MPEDASHLITFIAKTPDGTDIMFGRGNMNNPNSDAAHALRWVDTPTVALHLGVVANLDTAAEGEPITPANGGRVLEQALELAKASLEQ